MTDDNESEDDGITIKINDNSDEEDNSEPEDLSEGDTEDTSEQEDESILDEDGTVEIQSEEYEGNVRLVGTVHVSERTRDRVLDTIKEDDPDTVAIELDRERVYSMFERKADFVGGESVGEDDGGGLRDLIRKQQKQQFDGEGMLKPGEADMIPAALEGIEQGSNVAMVDMSVEKLKSNVMDNVYDEDGNLDLDLFNKSFSEIAQSVRGLVQSRSEMAEEVKEEGVSAMVEKLEDASLDEVRSQMDPLRDVAPEVIQALIDQRDQYMAGRIHWLRENGHDTVGVMGRGHIQGVYHYLQNPEQIDDEQIVEPDWYDYTVVDIN
jgi:pheromone shutdown protein TraB